MVMQSLSLGIAVVPIWRIARGPANLRTGGAAVLTFAYSLHPSIHNLNLAGFHPEALAIPALLAAYLSGHYEKWWVSSGLILLVLMILLVLFKCRLRPGSSSSWSNFFIRKQKTCWQNSFFVRFSVVSDHGLLGSTLNWLR